MYPNNIYIKHYAEIKKYAHLKHDDLARAQYKHWRSVQTGVPELLSRNDRDLLGI